MIYYFLIITIIFIIYSEISVTNILFRPNSSGFNSLNLNSLFYFMVDPLISKTLWTFRTLDINYPFVMIFSSFIYFLV